MGRGGKCALLLISILLAYVPAARATPGDPAPKTRIGCPREIRPCAPQIVVRDEVELIDGPAITVGFNSALGFCFAVDHRLEPVWSIACGLPLRPTSPLGAKLEWLGIFRTDGGRGDNVLTDIAGYASPAAEAVRVRFRRSGQTQEKLLPVLRMKGELQQEQQLRHPVGVFATTLFGCVRSRKMRFTALDASGTPIGDSGRGFSTGCQGFKSDRRDFRRKARGGFVLRRSG